MYYNYESRIVPLLKLETGGVKRSHLYHSQSYTPDTFSSVQVDLDLGLRHLNICVSNWANKHSSKLYVDVLLEGSDTLRHHHEWNINCHISREIRDLLAAIPVFYTKLRLGVFGLTHLHLLYHIAIDSRMSSSRRSKLVIGLGARRLFGNVRRESRLNLLPCSPPLSKPPRQGGSLALTHISPKQVQARTQTLQEPFDRTCNSCSNTPCKSNHLPGAL